MYGSLVPRVWLVGTWSTLILSAIASTLVAANVTAVLQERRDRICSLPRGFAASLAPTLLVVSSCCGTPVALLLGTSAVVFLYRATPWLLLATIFVLAASLTLTRRAPG